jgi:hypothetical protein
MDTLARRDLFLYRYRARDASSYADEGAGEGLVDSGEETV